MNGETSISMTNEELIAENAALNQKIAEMEGDVLTTVSTIAGLVKSFGINLSDFSNSDGQQVDIMSKIGVILPKITFQFASGTFDGQALQNMSALMPIFEKYKYLTEHIQITNE